MKMPETVREQSKRGAAVARPASAAAFAHAGSREAQEEGAEMPDCELDDHFLPVTRFAIIDRLLRRVEEKEGPEKAAAFRDFLDHLAAWRHQRYRDELLRLKEIYLPFSPDRDSVRVLRYTEGERASMQQELIKRLTWLLERANYRRIGENLLSELLSQHSPKALELKVDLDEFDQVLLFSRGRCFRVDHVRSLRTFFLKRPYQVPIFKRLFLLIKLKSEEERIKELMADHGISERAARRRLKRLRKRLMGRVSSDYIYLKMFKNIPAQDLEMLFPNTQVKFKLWDKIKLAVTAGSGTVGSVLGTAGGGGSKLLAAAGGAGLASMGPMALASALAGLAAVVYRQVTQFFFQRTKYMMELANRLYFHSLADNRGALTLLADRAEEEDIKEDMLLYYHLRKAPMNADGLEEMDRTIERFLQDEFSVRADYDITDAVQRLRGEGLIVEDDEGRLVARPLPEVQAHLKNLITDALVAKPSGDAGRAGKA